MFTGGELTRSNMPHEAQQPLEDMLRSFDDQARRACTARGTPSGRTPFGRSANFLAVVTPAVVFLVVDDVVVGGMPDHIYLDRRPDGAQLTLEAVIGGAVQEFGFRDPIGIRLPVAALHASDDARRTLLEPVAAEAAGFMAQRVQIQQLNLPAGYEHYARFMPAFLRDHPHPEANVLLMMRFRTGVQYAAVTTALRENFANYGLHVLRADDKDYTGDLWENVCLYVLGSRFGVAVFEEIDEREFNPNIALELGFMLALNKRCLILKDQRMPRLPTDIIGKLYKEFDTYAIPETVAIAISSWARDMDLLATGGLTSS